MLSGAETQGPRNEENEPITTDDIAKVLLEQGFTPNEAKIYCILITEGPISATIISRVAGVQRTETYNYLSNLRDKGALLITHSHGKGRNIKLFSAIPPEELLATLITKTQFDQNAMSQMIQKLKLIPLKTPPHYNDLKTEYAILRGAKIIMIKLSHMIFRGVNLRISFTNQTLKAAYRHGILERLFVNGNTKVLAVPDGLLPQYMNDLPPPHIEISPARGKISCIANDKDEMLMMFGEFDEAFYIKNDAMCEGFGALIFGANWVTN